MEALINQKLQVKNAKLHNGLEMPLVGLGVLKAREGQEVERAVQSALDSGYRLIDTAAIYRNEIGVGNAIKKSEVNREEVFLTTKVWNSMQGYDMTLRAFDQSLERLQLGYVDLYLIHWPVKDLYRESWKALEEIYRQGRAKAIGVSNFQVHHLEDLMEGAEILPMVNQVEMHPHLQQNELVEFARQHHIQLQAWRPIMMGAVNQVPELVEIGKKYGKTPVQVTLRWLLQQGVGVIPKSVNPSRIRQNKEIEDFSLSFSEMETIASLNQNKRLGPDPDNFNF